MGASDESFHGIAHGIHGDEVQRRPVTPTTGSGMVCGASALQIFVIDAAIDN